MKQLKFIVLLFVLLMLSACPNEHGDAYRFNNNSTVDVYMYFDLDFLGFTLYPDTAISQVRKGELFKQGKGGTYLTSYKYLFERNDTLSMFIFDAKIFDTYCWEDIRNDYKILQRYDISKENYETLRHSITYPPTEAMKNIKMYPPYGSE